MDWLTKMNRAMDYIETHLSGRIELEQVAQQACCSSYHFQRMFSFITNVTLAEYIRRRRLTLAALELLTNGNAKVIEVAMKYGYESPVSFARAFQQAHGVTPAMARQQGVSLKAYPRLSFLISIKGEEAMDYRMETKEAFDVFGIERVFDWSDETSTPSMLWQESEANGEVQRLSENAGPLPPFVNPVMDNVHGIYSYRETGENTFPYMIGAFKGAGSTATEDYITVTIPAHTWAIFPSKPFEWSSFDETIDTLYKRVFSEWFPTSGYEPEGTQLEVFGDEGALGYLELWFAVRKIIK
ncbi:helix-turn-helix domain-containing protein [Paenibacillus hodogayensis]|uniref:Helix-turn-helix domain-containing protein n=1 Tax=Paenibacillus hodogayensis TaxID=279208 RepID=A0ABV5VQM8_9BACL